MSDQWFYSLETGEIFRPHERGFDVMVEADGAAPTTARKIVKAVNSHDDLVSFVKQIISQDSVDDTYSLLKKGRELLDEIDQANDLAEMHLRAARSQNARLQNRASKHRARKRLPVCGLPQGNKRTRGGHDG